MFSEMQFDLEGQWTDQLATNNIVSIIRDLRRRTEKDKDDADEVLLSFSCWLQRTSEFTQKELLSLCFSRCQGLWMFLNRYSARRVHNLLQKLRNLLTLVHWARGKIRTGLHDVKVLQSIWWTREQSDLKKYLWLGRLVEWWNLMGLLPKRPESKGEKQITHMWKEMRHSHHKTGLTDEDAESSLVQGLVSHLVKQHVSLWTPESNGQQCYPPPSLKALLRLVLLPRVDAQSVQALIMYFILDFAQILQCRNDLFKSFCDTFTIPSSLSRQIKAFWMFDRGEIKPAMKLLLSPQTALPHSSWQHRCIIKSLLSRQEHKTALRYLYLTCNAMETPEDVKLCVDVWLKNSCVSEAWTLVKRNLTESADLLMFFVGACESLGLKSEATKCIPPGVHIQKDCDLGVATLILRDVGPCPLSASVYRAQRERVLSSEELLQLLIQAVMDLRAPPTCTLRAFTWPQSEHRQSKPESSEVFLSTEAPHLRSPSPSMLDPKTEDSTVDHPDPLSSCPSSVPNVSNRRRVSFSSVSSLSPIREDQTTFSYESTVTLQQISALLIDDPPEEEELSQVSVTTEVFPESAVVPVPEHQFTPHSFRSRFYSTDCVSDLPSLPEENVQTPTKSDKPDDVTPEVFNDSDVQKDELQQTEHELETSAVFTSTESIIKSQMNVENEPNLSHSPVLSVCDSAVVHDTSPRSSPALNPLHQLPPIPYFTLPPHKQGPQRKQTDRGHTAGRHRTGKLSVRSSRRHKRLK